MIHANDNINIKKKWIPILEQSIVARKWLEKSLIKSNEQNNLNKSGPKFRIGKPIILSPLPSLTPRTTLALEPYAVIPLL